MNGRASVDRVLRVVLAALVLAGGAIHLKLYFDGYKDVPNHNLGRSFLLNVAASVVVAVLVVVWRTVWSLLLALVLVDSTLVAFGISRTSRGIFGFTERGFQPSPEAVLALSVEIGAVVIAVVLLARALLAAPAGASVPSAAAQPA